MRRTHDDIPEFGWTNSKATPAHGYLISVIDEALHENFNLDSLAKLKIFDVGCGNGFLAKHLCDLGCQVTGCDVSEQGIELARRNSVSAKFEVCSVYDDLAERFGRDWDVVVSSEVIEHLYTPRKLVGNVFSLLKPGGVFIVTTPYHGYLKNLVLSLTGKMDSHFTALWDGGHIKFWSFNTLRLLLQETNFSNFKFYGAGRIPFLWKSMVISANKPIS